MSSPTIVSLVPGATEMVWALGAGDRLVGVSHACDHPPPVVELPKVTATPIADDLDGAGIDAAVRELVERGEPVIRIDADAVRRLDPDLVLVQDLCRVCAVHEDTVLGLGDVLSPGVRVVKLRGRTVGSVLEDIRRVADALGRAAEGERLCDGMERRMSTFEEADLPDGDRPRVVCVEWLDPPFLAGHWVPDLVRMAGGRDVGAEPGAHSVTTTWSEIHALEPDVALVMLCGFDVERADRELASAPEACRDLLETTPTWILDGNALTSRPGPRLADAVERIHAALFEDPPDGSELRRWVPRSASRSGSFER